MPEGSREYNTLFYGDNLTILRDRVATESVDLIYLDPPFNSHAIYRASARDGTDGNSAEPGTAFDDTWRWGEDSRAALSELVRGAPERVAALFQTFSTQFDGTGLMAYLVMMAVRLLELHRVLRSSGSIYLHCDPTASHYLKLVMDAVFGPGNFRNEIVWKRSRTRSSITRIFRRAHDVILFYSKSGSYTFNLPYRELSDGSKKLYKRRDERGHYQLVPLLVSGRRNGQSGAVWRGIDPNTRGKNGMHWITTPDKLTEYERQGLIYWPAKEEGTPRLKYYLHESEGVPVNDFWDDIALISSSSSESLGFPTQKPEQLLARIVEAGSDPGDLVLDPFCGCGTTLVAAQRLGRRWIGIDCSALATSLTGYRIHRDFGSDNGSYALVGGPTEPEEAKRFTEQDRVRFVWWVLSLVKARPVEIKNSVRDGNCDGFLQRTSGAGVSEQVLVKVQDRGDCSEQVRKLIRAVTESDAVEGIFITLDEPSQQTMDRPPEVKILTLHELLQRAQFHAQQKS